MWINLYSLTARLFYYYFWVNFLVLRLNLAFISCFHQPLDLWILSQSRILYYPISNLFTVLINLNLFYHVILYQSCIIQSQLPLPLNLKQRTKQSKYQINLIQLFLRFYCMYLFILWIYLSRFYLCNLFSRITLRLHSSIGSTLDCPITTPTQSYSTTSWIIGLSPSGSATTPVLNIGETSGWLVGASWFNQFPLLCADISNWMISETVSPI